MKKIHADGYLAGDSVKIHKFGYRWLSNDQESEYALLKVWMLWCALTAAVWLLVTL